MRKLLFFVFLSLSCLGFAAKEARTVRVLAIGNSFSEDAVEQYLYEIGVSGDYNLVIGNAYRAGQGLVSHWMDVSLKNNTFEYRKIVRGQRTVRKQQSLRHILQDEAWDYVTLQQVSQDAGRPDTYEPYLSYMIDYVRQHTRNEHMKLGFQMTWAYGPASTHLGFFYFNRNQQAMYDCIQQTAQWVMLAHREFDFLVPTGTAIQSARTSFLGNDLTRDGYHLDKTIGRYIAACTWYEALFRRRVSEEAFYPATISAEAAAVARQVANRARRSPYKVWVVKAEEAREEPLRKAQWR